MNYSLPPIESGFSFPPENQMVNCLHDYSMSELSDLMKCLYMYNVVHVCNVQSTILLLGIMHTLCILVHTCQ